jgi:hypothetical protein
MRPGPNRIIIGGMNGAGLHAIFDVAAWLAAGAAGWWLQRVQRAQLHTQPFPSQSFELPYLAALLFGAGIGAYLFGTLPAGGRWWHFPDLGGDPRSSGLSAHRNRPPTAKFTLFGRKSINQNANKPLIFGVF